MGAGSQTAERLLERADKERDGRQYQAAALLYEQVLGIRPDNAAIHIQCGHMFKEAGDLVPAERHYLAARTLSPDDPDLALQLGHFYKVAGRPEECLAAYRRAADLRPDWQEPLRELAEFRRRTEAPKPDEAWTGQPDAARLVPELVPRGADAGRRSFLDCVHIRRLGARQERSPWGMMSTLRGVEAVRGYCISSVPIDTLELLLDGACIDTSPVQAVPLGDTALVRRKYVFNVWIDVSAASLGLHMITLRFTASGREIRRHAEHVVIGPPYSEATLPGCDGVVELSADDPRPPEAQIRARPSVVRPARRTLLAEPPRNVLVLRTDQLGDLVTSIPALQRLRDIVPGAHLVGLLTSANAELAETLRLFDEIIVVTFPDDELERRRIMPLDVQEALRARLEPYRFDIAIDLAESAVSRPLLLLSGARFLYGFHDRDCPWLTGGFEGSTHDVHNGLEVAAQSTKVMALVERLGASLSSKAAVIRRPELTRGILAPLGIEAGDRFVVLHTGARIAFSRWPYYTQLASLFLDRTSLKVFIVTDDAAMRARLPLPLAQSSRFGLIDQRLPFDTFDALLSFCTVFAGNDSGPKHLASLRGTPVVSIHSARINWSEWGQEMTGSIISRKVPCAGCAIFHDSDECGKQFACIVDIGVEEVFAAMVALIEG